MAKVRLPLFLAKVLDLATAFHANIYGRTNKYGYSEYVAAFYESSKDNFSPQGLIWI
ncbi:hypothetical protein [Nostoc sp. WHI]|uniref:hypothetical protein n=1 Tax=Nostoc sp. WHI TaxID=2650611 RepID=UPI0018C746A5|nr:hypothetical protein [Nostoc sp. WHI]